MSVPYLQELTLRLALGASQLSPAIRERHTGWLHKQQRPDGGFAGREGESDPYYTAFALRALWILDALAFGLDDKGLAGELAVVLVLGNFGSRHGRLKWWQTKNAKIAKGRRDAQRRLLMELVDDPVESVN